MGAFFEKEKEGRMKKSAKPQKRERGRDDEKKKKKGDATAVAPKKKVKVKLVIPPAQALSLDSYAHCAPFTVSTEELSTREGGQRLLDVLLEHGVAIVPSVLNAEECAAFDKGFWDSLAHLTSAWPVPISKDKPESWRELSKLFPMHSMLIQHYGLGHAEFVWALRQNPKLHFVFSQLYGTKAEDLLVSFDGVAIHMPPETTGKGSFIGNTWYHTDQRFSDSSFSCVQGWVTALDVRPGDATLTVLRGSHAHHAEFAQRFGHGALKKDWYKLASQEELDFFIVEKGCRPVSIACPAGSLVLWDSRTMHAGQEPLIKERAEPNFREIVYLCYLPRSAATEKDLAKKRDAFLKLRMTSHWPQKPMLFGLSPQTYGGPKPEVTPLPGPTNVSALGRRLAGF